jgi:hypothetical protein
MESTWRVHSVRSRALAAHDWEFATDRYRQLWDARFDELDTVVEELKRKENIDGRKKRE